MKVVAAVVVAATTMSGVPSGVARAADSSNVPTTTQLAALKADADAVRAKLTAGTRKLEAAKANLTSLQHKGAAAKAAAAALDAKLATLRLTINHIAGDMYERPVRDKLSEVLAGDNIAKSLQASQLLVYADDSQTRALRELVVDSEESQVLRTQADQDVAAAVVVRKSVNAQVGELRDEAAKAAKKLESAQAAYEAEQARLEAQREAAAEAAREKAVREAAAKAAREKAALAKAASAPACTSARRSYPAGAWGGFSDGLIPTSALCAIIGGGMLRPDAAAAFNRMSLAYRKAFGSPLCVTASYRPYSDQVRLYRIEPSMAAIPGTSNHGWGLAVDLCGGVQRSGSPQYRWMTRHAGAFGWVHPPWAFHDPFEPWHWEFGHLGGAGTT